ncbi:MAG: hypothetical protein AB1942_13145 [Pseudomonadota bacterium]
MDARHGRMLAELAETGMGVARGLYAATRRELSHADFALLAEAFHTVSRSIRQTIALELKLKHEPRQPAQPKPVAPPASSAATPPPLPRPERPEQVYWNEYERADWDEPLDAALGAGDAAAINDAVEASIARIQRGLGKAQRVLVATTACHPSHSEAASRDPVGPTPQTRPRTRSALLSTSSPLDPGATLRFSRDDTGGRDKAPKPPPWRNSA